MAVSSLGVIESKTKTVLTDGTCASARAGETTTLHCAAASWAAASAQEEGSGRAERAGKRSWATRLKQKEGRGWQAGMGRLGQIQKKNRKEGKNHFTII
jgi:hypothetical protein